MERCCPAYEKDQTENTEKKYINYLLVYNFSNFEKYFVKREHGIDERCEEIDSDLNIYAEESITKDELDRLYHFINYIEEYCTDDYLITTVDYQISYSITSNEVLIERNKKK